MSLERLHNIEAFDRIHYYIMKITNIKKCKFCLQVSKDIKRPKQLITRRKTLCLKLYIQNLKPVKLN